MKRHAARRTRFRWIGFAAFSVLFHLTAFAVLFPIFAIRAAVRILRDKESETLKVALLLALLIHVCLIFPLGYWLLRLRDEGGPESRTMVDLWGEAEEKEKTPEEELESYDPKEKLPDGQVVQTPQKGARRRPDRRARFLSERDNAVDKETAATLRIPGAPSETPSPKLNGQSGDSRREKKGGAPELLTTVGPPSPELSESDKGDLKKTDPGDVDLSAVRLQPSESAMRAALAGTGLDNLENVITGDSTALNTYGWEYASFFNRVKSLVERYWHPDREFRERDPYGNIYGVKDRTTVLLVILRADGSLKKTYIMESSGAAFLDEEASSALKSAAPFPNVPAGLLDRNDNLVKFTFHFIVRVGEGPIFRMRRY